MKVNLNKLVGEEFSVEHRLLNIVLLFAILIAIWSSITNYLLHLDDYLVLASVLSIIILAGLYYLSFIRKQYNATLSIFITFAVIIVPIAWIFNGGLESSIPFYIVMFSSIAASSLFGLRRIALILYFIVISSLLILIEYKYPFIISNYSSDLIRYTDVWIGIITTITFNTAIILVILKYYKKEHEKANRYLQASLKAQKKLTYLSYHDILTGLYNRTYFEKISANIEYKADYGIGVFGIDLDGLKFVNDTLGHEQGDLLIKRAAKILQAAFSDKDTIARIGGDEFAIIVPDIMQRDMEALYKKIYDCIQNENENLKESVIPLKMSVGYAYSADAANSISTLLHEADKKMYREKLFHKSKTEGSIIQTVKNMLSARDFDTGEHSKRLQTLIAKFALAADLPKSEIADIQLFAEFHDVGKIGIPDHILYKAEPLTLEEQNHIKQHCEIGYRIAKTSTDLLPIADLILRHHEWWDGSGYPLGIKGEEIPIKCRIVAIADAYDAMTSNRPYRKAMSHESAIQQIKKMAGIQFDYKLVQIFIKCISSDTRHILDYPKVRTSSLR
jgi:diguanylate cyclase (GGDEF)-like protein